MAQVLSNLEILSTRSGFNSAVRHIKRTVSIVESLGGKDNLADLLAESGADSGSSEECSGGRVALLLRMLLVDKLGYAVASVNLESVCEDPKVLAAVFETWNAVDLVLAYHHPDLGLLVANPKRAEQLAAFGSLRKRELLVAYAGRFDKGSDELCEKAVVLALSLFQGKSIKVPEALLKGPFSVKKAKKEEGVSKAKAPKDAAKRSAAREKVKSEGPTAPVLVPQASAATKSPAPVVRGPARMTPMYSVVVQNELFHNGNVEAWKRIIDSYKTKYPDLEVYIYYDGERIININSLFKWGKVKHGSTIQFAVAGSDIKDVAKLQRYLMQGASHQFEAFLHGPVSTVLKLF